MAHTFVAFIDEAGDEGFRFVPRPARQSSEWFIMAAAVMRTNMVQMLDHALTDFRKAWSGKGAFHFRDADHHERVAFIEAIRSWPYYLIAVAVHKPGLLDSPLRNQRHLLYQYTAKMLIERVSWCANEHKGERPATTKLLLAERGQLRMARLLGYLDTLKTSGRNHNIRWSAIDVDLIEVAPFRDHTGLQVADVAAGSVEKALELSRHSTTEHRYIKLWQRRFYRRAGQCNGNGLKVFPAWPDEADDPFTPNRLHWLKHFE